MKDKFLSLLQVNNKDCFIDDLESDFILVIGMMPSRDAELFSSLEHKKNIVYLSVIEDKKMSNISQIQSRYEAGSEEGVVAIFTKEILSNKNIDSKTKDFFDNLDEGYLSAECNVGEEEIEEIVELYKKAKNPVLVLGYDLFNHPRKYNLAKLISLLVKFGNFKIYTINEDIVQDEIENSELENIGELHSFDGSVVYSCPSVDEEEEEFLMGSSQFMTAAKINDEQEVFVITESGEYPRKFVLDKELKGTVALMPSTNGDGSYYYKIAKIIKREN